jgi:hypothetical protein
MAHGRLILESSAARLRSRRDLLKACYLGDLDRAAELAGDPEPGPSAEPAGG